MRKGYMMIKVLLVAAIVAGCSSAGGGTKIEQMDFQAEMDWKVPEPAVGKRPRILFVGNSHIFYNDLSGTFARIANAFGYKSDVYELSKGHYSLKQYRSEERRVGKEC